MVSSENAAEGIQFTEDETAQYDRQIRLWGIEAQRRLKGSHILVIGFSHLANEVAKNLALVGVKELTIVDHCTESEEKAKFEEALTRIKRLNPLVKVSDVKDGLAALEDNQIAEFSVILVTNSKRAEIERLRKVAYTHGTPFFVGDTFGFFGFFFADLAKQLNEEKEMVDKERVQLFTDFQCGKSNAKNRAVGAGFMLAQIVLEFRERKGRLPDPRSKHEDSEELVNLRKEIREFTGVPTKVTDEMLGNVYGDEVSVAAVVGGVLSQEVVRSVTCLEKNIDNFFFFDSFALSGIVQQLKAD